MKPSCANVRLVSFNLNVNTVVFYIFGPSLIQISWNCRHNVIFACTVRLVQSFSTNKPHLLLPIYHIPYNFSQQLTTRTYNCVLLIPGVALQLIFEIKQNTCSYHHGESLTSTYYVIGIYYVYNIVDQGKAAAGNVNLPVFDKSTPL